MTHDPALVAAVARALLNDRFGPVASINNNDRLQATAALDAIAAAGRLVPDAWVANAWVTVPKEPTKAMMEAFMLIRHCGYRHIYRAMVAAASVEAKPDE